MKHPSEGSDSEGPLLEKPLGEASGPASQSMRPETSRRCPRVACLLGSFALAVSVWALFRLQKDDLSIEPFQPVVQDESGERWRARVLSISQAHPQFPQPRSSAKTALCFSGGGSRSLSLSMGQYRAFVGLGILPGGVAAISSISGGTWASAQYMFSDEPASVLLGDFTEPSTLSMAKLRKAPPMMGATATTDTLQLALNRLKIDKGKCWRRVCRFGDSFNCWRIWKEVKCTVETFKTLWIDVIGEAMLGPYGLPPHSYMAASFADVRRIVSQNPGLKRKKFAVPVSDRPETFVMGGSLLAPLGFVATRNNIVSLQMSPDYIGAPFYPDGGPVTYKSDEDSPEDLTAWVGGGMIEAFAFGGAAPAAGQGSRRVEQVDQEVPVPPTPFSLADAVGISSAAFAMAITDFFPVESFDPQGLYWPILEGIPELPQARNYTFGDGGDYENLGLLQMMQSGTNRLACLFNTITPLNKTIDLCNTEPGAELSGTAACEVTGLFGHNANCASIGYEYMKNQVFEYSLLAPLLCSLQTMRDAGRPAVAKGTYEVIGNTWWGIPSGWEVTVIFVYNEVVSDFENQLPSDTRDALALGSEGPFANYPFYKTMEQNPGGLTNLEPEQVNLLASQGEYVIRQNHALFCEVFDCKESLLT